MSPSALAIEALGAVGIAAPRVEQVTRCVALAAYALAQGDPQPFATAATQLLADEAGQPEEK